MTVSSDRRKAANEKRRKNRKSLSVKNKPSMPHLEGRNFTRSKSTKPEKEKEEWKESEASKKRRKFLRIGAAIAEAAGGTDYAKEAAGGETINLGKKDKKKKKNKGYIKTHVKNDGSTKMY